MNVSQKKALEQKIWEFLLQGNIRKAIEFAFVGDGNNLKGYGNELFRYTKKTLQDEETAKDVFATFAQQICQSIETFQQESSFRSWAYVILKRTIFKFIKERNKKDFRPLRIKNSAESFEIGSGDSIPESKIKFDGTSLSLQIHRADQKEKLGKLIEKLSVLDQEILSMLLYRYMSYEEIANELSKTQKQNITQEVIRQRYHRMQKKLKRLAEESGYL